jgi:hypothetical protein
VWIKPSSIENARTEWESGCSLGAIGLWIDAGALDAPLNPDQLEVLQVAVHATRSGKGNGHP